MAGAFGAMPFGGFTCLTGLVQRAPLTSQFIGGTHVLVDVASGVIAALLRSDTVNLAGLEGQVATVCGSLQVTFSAIHGRQVLLTVTLAQPALGMPGLVGFPPFFI